MELFDVGAERALLAGMLQYGSEAYIEISDFIEPDSFGSLENQIIFKCLSDVLENEQKIDFPSIFASAEKLNLKETISTDQEIEYIKSLKNFHIEKENIYSFGIQIKKYQFARQIKSTLNSVEKKIDNISGNESIEEIVSILEDPITNFIREENFGENPEIIGEDIFDHLTFLEENKCDVIGIPTGFKRFDEAIGGGLRRKSVDLIGARAKCGKSMFADAAACNIASKKIPVLMLDTEMDTQAHIHRMLGSISGVKTKEIETGKFANNEDKKQKVYEAAEKIKELPYHYLNISGKPFEQVLNIIKRWVTHVVKQDENGVTNECVIIYDYLKLMSGNDMSKNLQEYQILGFQITALHNLCVKLDIPCLSFVQLNRDGINKEGEDAVSGSDRLIWLCTSFTIFKKKSEEELAEDGPKNGNRKLIPIVSRYGGGLQDGDYINMQMSGDIGRLEELTTRNETKIGGLLSEKDLEKIEREEESKYENKS